MMSFAVIASQNSQRHLLKIWTQPNHNLLRIVDFVVLSVVVQVCFFTTFLKGKFEGPRSLSHLPPTTLEHPLKS